MVTRRLTPIPAEEAAIPRPRFDELEHARWRMDYDPQYDLLRIVIGEPRPALSLDLDGMWMRLEPDTGEILGFEIPDFVHSFLPKHPELAMQLEQTMQDRKRGTPLISEPVSWMNAFFAFIQRICGGPGGGSHGKLSIA